MTTIPFPFKKIVAIVKQLSNKKETGTFFIIAKANYSSRLIFSHGDIVSVYCCNKFGEEGLDMMLDITSGTCTFRRGKTSERQEQLPNTSDILQTLARAAQGFPKEIKESSIKKQTGISASQKMIFEECLEEYIGAMAPLLCEEHTESNTDIKSILQALELVVKDISGNGAAQKFKQEVTRRLT